MSLVFGNPEPMPQDTVDDTGGVYEKAVVELVAGWCGMMRCEFPMRNRIISSSVSLME